MQVGPRGRVVETARLGWHISAVKPHEEIEVKHSALMGKSKLMGGSAFRSIVRCDDAHLGVMLGFIDCNEGQMEGGQGR